MGDFKRGKDTPYLGYRFRSTLEARWAMFFHLLRIPFDYEFQAFDILDGYLPDFYLDLKASLLINRLGERGSGIWHGTGAFVEVKPVTGPDREEEEKLELLATVTGHAVILLCGDPAVGPHHVVLPEYCPQTRLTFSWAMCPNCQSIGLVYPWVVKQKIYRQLGCCGRTMDKDNWRDRALYCERLVKKAVIRSRSKRFKLRTGDAAL